MYGKVIRQQKRRRSNYEETAPAVRLPMNHALAQEVGLGKINHLISAAA